MSGLEFGAECLRIVVVEALEGVECNSTTSHEDGEEPVSQKYNMSHLCNFNFSSSHIKKGKRHR